MGGVRSVKVMAVRSKIQWRNPLRRGLPASQGWFGLLYMVLCIYRSNTPNQQVESIMATKKTKQENVEVVEENLSLIHI